jgi:hypothetical protein
LFRADRRTDILKLIVALRNFANATRRKLKFKFVPIDAKEAYRDALLHSLLNVALDGEAGHLHATAVLPL